MESRYALRELEGAIGYDCRTLRDGRAALFRHTAFHKRLRRDFFERRDALSVMQSSLLSAAGVSSHPKIDIKASSDSIGDLRAAVMEIAFPYMKKESSDSKKKDNGKDEYDQYFDELDAIIAEKNAESAKSAAKPADVGDEGVK